MDIKSQKEWISKIFPDTALKLMYSNFLADRHVGWEIITYNLSKIKIWENDIRMFKDTISFPIPRANGDWDAQVLSLVSVILTFPIVPYVEWKSIESGGYLNLKYTSKHIYGENHT